MYIFYECYKMLCSIRQKLMTFIATTPKSLHVSTFFATLGGQQKRIKKSSLFLAKLILFPAWKRQNSYLFPTSLTYSSDHIPVNLGSSKKKMIHPCMFKIQTIRINANNNWQCKTYLDKCKT